MYLIQYFVIIFICIYLLRSDERQSFLEVIYSAPEELLSEFGATVGILGLKRSNYDEMLVKKKISKKKKSVSEDEINEEEIEEEVEEEEPENESEIKQCEITFHLPKKFIHRYLQI